MRRNAYTCVFSKRSRIDENGLGYGLARFSSKMRSKRNHTDNHIVTIHVL